MTKFISALILLLSLHAQAVPFFDFGPTNPKDKEKVAPPPTLMCFSSTLVNSNGVIVHQFDLDFQCDHAVATQKGNFICAIASLKNLDGNVVHDFQYDFQCEDTLKGIHTLLFCAENILLNLRGLTVHTFESASVCQDSLAKMKLPTAPSEAPATKTPTPAPDVEAAKAQ